MKTVTKTALANVKQNKGRNFLCGCAIALTTFLIFVVLTVGYGMIRVQLASVDAYYPTYHIMFRQVSEKNTKALQVHNNIPVFGGFEPAVLLALGLADRIGIVTVLPNVIPMLQRHSAAHHLDRRIVSIRDVGIPVLALDNHETLCSALIQESVKAVREDNVLSLIHI